MENIKAFLKITVRDKDGNIKYESEKMKSKSFLLQYMQHIFLFFAQNSGSVANIKDTGGVLQTVYGPNYGAGTTNAHKIDAFAPDNNSTYGIVVGNGGAGNPVTTIDYKLFTQILHGLTAGTLDHGAMSISDAIDNITYVSYQLSRNFYNATASNISFDEVGIYVWSSQGYYCIIRDTISSVLIGPDQTAAVQYFMETYP